MASIRALVAAERLDSSVVGTVWVALTVAVMLSLAVGKHSVGAQLGNPALVTEAKVTLIDALLAAAVLLGLLANAALGWSWADPAAALVIVYYAVREGIEALTTVASPRTPVRARGLRLPDAPPAKGPSASEFSGPGQLRRITDASAPEVTSRSANATTSASSSCPATGMKSGIRSNGIAR